MIDIVGVSKFYAKHTALDKVSFSISGGRIFGLLGPNGAGKTSLIRILNQITLPDEGEIRFKGEKLSENHTQKFGYLPEERGLYKKMKVGEQLVYLARLKGMTAKAAQESLKYYIDRFEIKEWLGKKIEELSKGMQQKVQFVATIAHSPDVIILDEPFSGFDPINAELLTNEILNLKAQGKTIMLSTHRMENVEELCDDIALINKSKLLVAGRVRDVRRQFATNKFKVMTNAPINGVEGIFNVETSLPNRDEHVVSILVPMDGADGNAIIAALLGQTSILSFEELIPSMSEVFIRLIQNQN